MTEWLPATTWVAAGQIVMIDILLSGDNAVVIALACRTLPERQRRVAIFWGVFGAVAARVALTSFAAVLLVLPWVKLVGAILLARIGIQLIGARPGGASEVQADERLWAAIRTIVTADVVMSLDNVIGVAAAARGSIPLLVFGLALSIPIVVLGSRIVLKLLTHLPVLVIAGGGLLGYIAGEMSVTDPVAVAALGPNSVIDVVAPFAGFAFVVGVGLALAGLQRRRLTAT